MALRNFTRNLRMSLYNFELELDKKKHLGKTVLEMWSQVCVKITMLVNKVTLIKKKVQKSKKHRKLKT